MAEAPEQSKSALKKLEKQAKMAAEKAQKAAKNVAKQATLPVGSGKKTDDIIGITVKKEEDFPAWVATTCAKTLPLS